MIINKLNLKVWLIAFALISFNLHLLLAESGPTPEPVVYNYHPQVVELQGVVKGLRAYGPPNFGEDPETDKVEGFYVLKLDKPININKSGDFGAESNVSEIQLAICWPDAKEIFGTEKAPNINNEEILVRGTLYHSHTARHHRNVLIFAEKIELLKKGVFHSIGIKLLNFYESVFRKPPIESITPI